MNILCPAGLYTESSASLRHGQVKVGALTNHERIESRGKWNPMNPSSDNSKYGSLVPSESSSARYGGLDAYFRGGLQLQQLSGDDGHQQGNNRPSAAFPTDASISNNFDFVHHDSQVSAATSIYSQPALPAYASGGFPVVDWTRRQLSSGRTSFSAEEPSLLRSSDSNFNSSGDAAYASDDNFNITRRSSMLSGGHQASGAGARAPELRSWMLADPIVSPSGSADTQAIGTAATCSSTIRPDAAQSRHLWLGNLNPSIPRQLLLHLLEEFGNVEELVTAPGGCQALVSFSSMSDAILAKNSLPARSMTLELASEAHPLLVEYRAAPQAIPVDLRPRDFSGYIAKSQERSNDLVPQLTACLTDNHYPAGSSFSVPTSNSSDVSSNEVSTPPSKHLWLGNIPLKPCKAAVEECFQSFGALDNVRVFPGKTYAFVNFVHTADAAVARYALDGLPRPEITGTRPMIIRFQADSSAAAAVAKQEAKASSLGRDSSVFDPSNMLKVCQMGMELAEEVKGQQTKLSNRLNPNNLYFDPDLAERYKRMSKMEKEMLWTFDRRVRAPGDASTSTEPNPAPSEASRLTINQLIRSGRHPAERSPFSSQPSSPRTQQPSSPRMQQAQLPPPPPPPPLGDQGRRATTGGPLHSQAPGSSMPSSFAQLSAPWAASSVPSQPSRLSEPPSLFSSSILTQPLDPSERGSSHGAVGTRPPSTVSGDTVQQPATYDSFAGTGPTTVHGLLSEGGREGGGSAVHSSSWLSDEQ